MNFMVRRAVADDYETILKLQEEVQQLHAQTLPSRFQLETRYSKKVYLENISSEDSLVIVAQDDRQVVGFILANIFKQPATEFFAERQYLFINTIAVQQRHRRQGIGHALFEYAEQQAVKRQVEGIELNVYAFNKPAIDFYISLGYQPIQMRMYKQIDTISSHKNNE